MKKTEQTTFRLSDDDLQDLKEICRSVLEVNIAVKTFQSKHAGKVEHKKTQKESIKNSKRALEMLNDVENAESLNNLIREGVGDNAWHFFVTVLGVFSGSLSDPAFYDYDKEITDKKKKASN